jgi:DNA-binding NtrC family response regulator
VERAVTFCHEDEILPEHLPARIRRTEKDNQRVIDAYLNDCIVDGNVMPSLEEIENAYIRHVLQAVQGNKSRASSILGIGRRTLYRRLGMDDNGRTGES